MNSATVDATARPSDVTAPASPAGLLSLPALLVLVVGFRLTALFLLRYGGTAPDWSDFRYYHELAALSAQGYYPDVHFWVEYPPLFPWLAVGAYRLSLLLPPWTHPFFWFDLILTLALAVGDVASTVALDRLGDAFWGEPAGRRVATIYAAAFLPTYAVLGWFDSLPTACLLVALALLVAMRPGQIGRAAVAGVFVGSGVMLKLFPILALPAAVILSRRQHGAAEGSPAFQSPRTRIKAESGWKPAASPLLIPGPLVTTLTTLGTIALVAAPFLWRSPETFLATFRNVAARGSWLSPWALLDGYYGPGTVASLSDRLFFNASALWGQPARYPALWWLAAVLGGVSYLWVGRAAWRDATPRAALALTGFGVTLLLLLSRGFSQQFVVWVMPFVVLVMPGVDGALLAVLLGLDVLVLDGYLYVTLFPTFHRLLWVSVAGRTALLLWFAVECVAAIDPKRSGRYQLLRRRLTVPALGVAVLGVLLGGALLIPALATAALARSGDQAAVAAIRELGPGVAVVFTQPTVYDRLSGAIQPRPVVLVAEPRQLTWTGDRSLDWRLTTTLAGRSVVALVTDPGQPTTPVLPAVRRWLTARYGNATDRALDQLAIAEFREANRPAARRLDVAFGDSLHLIDVTPATLAVSSGTPVDVTLRWEARAPLARDYTISLQLLDPGGALIAQHDAMPVENTRPTSSWRPGEVIYDPIHLDLPPRLAPGAYVLSVVVYDRASLQRLPAHGTTSAGDHAIALDVDVREGG